MVGWSGVVSANARLLHICGDERVRQHASFLEYQKLINDEDMRFRLVFLDWDAALLASVRSRKSLLASTIALTRRLHKCTMRTGLIEAIKAGNKHVAIVLIARGADNLIDAFATSVTLRLHSIADWIANSKHSPFDMHDALGHFISSGSGLARDLIHRYIRKLDLGRVKQILVYARCWPIVAACVRAGLMNVDWFVVKHALMEKHDLAALQLLLASADEEALALGLSYAMSTGDALLATRVLDASSRHPWSVCALVDAIFQAPRESLRCVDELLERVRDGDVTWGVIRRCIETEDCVLLSRVLSTMSREDVVANTGNVGDAMRRLQSASDRVCVSFICGLPL